MTTIQLSSIKPSTRLLPPRVTIYGPEKIGKSSLAAQIPGALFIDIEGGTGALDVARVMRDTDAGMLTTYDSFSQVLTTVETQDHAFKALVIDSVDWLEALVFEQVARQHGKQTIADIGYGAGHVAAEGVFRDILRRLDGLRAHRNMVIVLIGHSEVTKFDNPLTASYDQYRLKLHKRISPLVNEWSDCLLVCEPRSQGHQGGQRHGDRQQGQGSGPSPLHRKIGSLCRGKPLWASSRPAA